MQVQLKHCVTWFLNKQNVSGMFDALGSALPLCCLGKKGQVLGPISQLEDHFHICSLWFYHVYNIYIDNNIFDMIYNIIYIYIYTLYIYSIISIIYISHRSHSNCTKYPPSALTKRVTAMVEPLPAQCP